MGNDKIKQITTIFTNQMPDISQFFAQNQLFLYSNFLSSIFLSKNLYFI